MEGNYKLNHLSFNQTKTQFCLCYNKGIKTYIVENFKEKCSSNNLNFELGNVSKAALLVQYDLVLFVGDKNNPEFNDKKLVLYDLSTQSVINSKEFQSSILNIRSINHFIILNIENTLKIFMIQEKEIIDINIEVPIIHPVYEIWEKLNDSSLDPKFYLTIIREKEIIINIYKGEQWTQEEKGSISIKNPFKTIQGMFYISKLNQIFIVDENASYITSFETEEGKEKYNLYRGKVSGVITSMTLLLKNYLAASNINRTIHIFNLDVKSNSFSVSNMIYGFIYSKNYLNPYMKIKFDELIREDDDKVYESYFKTKGAILVSKYDDSILNVITYNGYAYKINVDLTKKKFEILSRDTFITQFNSDFGPSEIKNISIFSSVEKHDTE